MLGKNPSHSGVGARIFGEKHDPRGIAIQAMVQQRRFHKFPEFEHVVMDVYAASGPQPCIPNLYNEILDRAAAIR